MQRAKAGLGDDVGQVGVWLLSVCEVEVTLRDVNHLRLLHLQRADAAGNFHRQLVLHRENVHHHRLETRGGGQGLNPEYFNLLTQPIVTTLMSTVQQLIKNVQNVFY